MPIRVGRPRHARDIQKKLLSLVEQALPRVPIDLALCVRQENHAQLERDGYHRGFLKPALPGIFRFRVVLV